MIVLLPVCSKDHAAALRNLDWLASLNPTPIPLTCLVVHESNFNAASVLAAAKRCFATVEDRTYSPYHGPQKFPYPANYAFHQSARLMLKHPSRFPWLWWEQDAIPLVADAFIQIRDEYFRRGRPFIGTNGQLVTHDQPQHLNGVAVYPHDLFRFAPHMFASNRTPFDILGGSRVYANAYISPLFQHVYSWDGPEGPPPTFTTPESLTSISPAAVLFHRCKDASLVNLLSRQRFGRRMFSGVTRLVQRHFPKLLPPPSPTPSPTPIQSNLVSDVSVVITNFRRAQWLWKAFESCLNAKVQHIVISSSSVTDEVTKVLEKISLAKPDVVISALPEDDGCNKNWLRGARLVKTSRMTILHDDDMLLPAYESVVAGRFDADIIHWDGAKHMANGPIDGTYVTRPDVPEGLHPSTYLLSLLLYPFSNSLSPVCGCFPTDHVINTLEECDRSFGSWAYLRPTMMVGNDMLLWLRACERLRTVYYSHVPMCSYGHWDGSASFDDASHHRMRLLPIYRRTRGYWLDTIPRIVHCVPRYMATTAESSQRIRDAVATWEIGPAFGLAETNHQWTFPRDSLSIKEPKATPFLRDILMQACQACRTKNDIIVFTNDDTLISLYWWLNVLDWMKDHPAGCSFRKNIKTLSELNPWIYPDPKIGVLQPGRDAFCFRQEWIQDNINDIPDYITGFGDWDSTLAMLIRLSAGKKPTADEFTREDASSEIRAGSIFHVDHQADWTRNANSVGMKHNRALTDEFFRSRLGWSMPKLRGDW